MYRVSSFVKAEEGEKLFSALEQSFALHLLGAKEGLGEETIALCFLLAVSFEGHLCVETFPSLFPDPSFLFQRNGQKEGKEEIEEKIQRGFKKLFSLTQKENSLLQRALVFYKTKVYLQRNFFLESKIVHEMKRLLESAPRVDFLNKEKFFDQVQELYSSSQLLLEQKEAIEKSFCSSFSQIVGGPGTGKSYIAGHMLSLYASSFDASKKKQLRIVFAAPTGRALLHLQQSLMKRVAGNDQVLSSFSTLHSLLKVKEGVLNSFPPTPLMADLIIVDEASMMDPRLMASLLSSVLPGSRLILMGDAEQLPAVEGGAIFAEMVAKKSFLDKSYSTFLTKAVRFENPSIDAFSKAVLKGDVAEAKSIQEGVSLHFLKEERKLEEKFLLEGSYFFSPPFMGQVEVEKCFAILEERRLLCPKRSSFTGVDHLNQQFFLKMVKKASFGEKVALPILISANHAQKELYNGLLGILTFTFRGEKEPFSMEESVYFWNEEEKAMRSWPLFQLPSYEYGYLLSVHKSQGSEFSHVALFLPEGSERFGQEMLYTAVTRAKKSLTVIGNEKTFEELFSKKTTKSSGFLERLQEEETRLRGFL